MAVTMKRQRYLVATGCFNRAGWHYVYAPQPPVLGFPRGHRLRSVIKDGERKYTQLRCDIISGTIEG